MSPSKKDRPHSKRFHFGGLPAHWKATSEKSCCPIRQLRLWELIANAWDAYARKVDIILPKLDTTPFSIEDDGCGMSSEEFEERWTYMDYDRLESQGGLAESLQAELICRIETYMDETDAAASLHSALRAITSSL